MLALDIAPPGPAASAANTYHGRIPTVTEVGPGRQRVGSVDVLCRPYIWHAKSRSSIPKAPATINDIFDTTQVQHGGIAAAGRLPKRALLLCYPPPGDSMASDALRKYRCHSDTCCWGTQQKFPGSNSNICQPVPQHQFCNFVRLLASGFESLLCTHGG